ncbi:YncE family protein [Flavobacterium sp.]|uniref:YncE family protein n=1 Tax=Flavobacterium sp. TaxID=239 RepID=UPI003D0B968C
MKLFKLSAVALFSALSIVSCTKDETVENVSLGAYENGFLVLNEGGNKSGTVTYISNDLGTIKKDIYGAENNGDVIGKYAQNIFYNANTAYIVAGGSNQVVVVDKNTFKTKTKITKDFVAPRYGVVVGDKAYVTNANTYSYANPATGNTDDYVAVINTTTNSVEKKIDLGITADRILAYNNTLYITEPYNSTKLVIVDLKDNSVDKSLEIGSGTNSMEIKNGILYMLNDNGLVSVNLSNNQLTTTVLGKDFAGAKNLDIEGDAFFFTVGTKAFRGNIVNRSVDTKEIFNYTSTSQYGAAYGFKVVGGNIFIADGGDFASEGKIFVYSTSGNLIKEIGTGIGPNGFY